MIKIWFLCVCVRVDRWSRNAVKHGPRVADVSRQSQGSHYMSRHHARLPYLRHWSNSSDVLCLYTCIRVCWVLGWRTSVKCVALLPSRQLDEDRMSVRPVDDFCSSRHCCWVLFCDSSQHCRLWQEVAIWSKLNSVRTASCTARFV